MNISLLDLMILSTILKMGVLKIFSVKRKFAVLEEYRYWRLSVSIRILNIIIYSNH